VLRAVRKGKENAPRSLPVEKRGKEAPTATDPGVGKGRRTALFLVREGGKGVSVINLADLATRKKKGAKWAFFPTEKGGGESTAAATIN